MKYKIQILMIALTISILFSEYPDYNVTINSNPYPSKLFVHTMSQVSPHMAIFNPDLSLNWEINSGEQGFDFRNNNNHLSYYDKESKFWIIANSSMVEIDTLQCTQGITDYHDIRLLDDGGYILQCYDSTWVDLGAPTPQLIRDILVIQEFDRDDNLILNWDAMDYLSIDDYPNINTTLPNITFMHGNSIEVDSDNNLLLSNRVSNEVLKINRVTGPYDVNSFAVIAALAALKDQAFIDAYVQEVLHAKDWIKHQLIQNKIHHHIDGGNYFLLWPKTKSSDVEESLRAAGILVRDMKGKSFIEGALRVSIGTTEQMNHFWKSFSSIDLI